MADAGIVVGICHYGGEFTTSGPNSNLIYNGGKTHAVAITRDLSLESFKNELSKVFHVDVADMSLKYFLPNNNKTLITISCDLHLQRMVDLTSNAAQVHIFLISRQEKRGFQLEFGNDITFTTTAGGASLTPEILDQQKLALDDNIPMEAFSDGAFNPYVGFDIMEEEPPQELNPTVLWDDDNDIIKGVGQEFDNVKDFHAQLCKYAMGKGFAYRFIKNETTRVTAKCAAEGGCTWRLHASESSRNKKFVIKKLIDEHTCGGGGGMGQRRGTRQWLTSIIKEKLDDNPMLKPKDLVKELYEEYGVTPSYGQVWRGKEVAEKELYHAMREAHNHLPWYCQRLEETNPGSITMLSPLLGAAKFRRFFVAFHACLHGFVNGCRPLLFLDKVPLKATNAYKLLVAAAVDADDGVFPVAFNVVEDENHDTWVWFLTQLKMALQTHNYAYYHAMTFLSSGHRGLDAAVSRVLEGSPHAFCFHRIRQEFKGELRKGPWSQEIRERMVEDLTRAAQACSIEDLNSSIESIWKISSEAADWVMARKPEHWSDAIFRGCRYGHFSLNIIADAFDNWIPAKKESSVVLMVDSLRIKIKEVMESRREACTAWAGPLTPTAEDKVQDEVLNACKMDVVRSSETVFEVRGDAVLVVNLASLECTCRKWQLSGLPCSHAVAVFNRLGQSFYGYCSKWFGIESYQLTYWGTIFAVPELDTVDFSAGIPHLPPPKKQGTSSEKRRRRRSNPNKISTLRRLCSRCKQAGHNKATCEAPQF